MNKNTKLILDVIGILISVSSLAALIADEKYIISGLILLILVALVVYGVRLLFTKPYKVKKITYSYKFCDSGPELTEISKTVLLVPKEKNITRLDDVGIGADGMVFSIVTNNGNTTTSNSGGSISVATIFDTALPIDQEYIHKLTYQGKDCFSKTREDVVHSTIHKMDEATIELEFHGEKRPSNFKAIHRVGSKLEEVTDTHVQISNLNYTFNYQNPPRGSVFELKWEW